MANYKKQMEIHGIYCTQKNIVDFYCFPLYLYRLFASFKRISPDKQSFKTFQTD